MLCIMRTEHPELRYADTVSHCKPTQAKELTWQSSQLFCPNTSEQQEQTGHRWTHEDGTLH